MTRKKLMNELAAYERRLKEIHDMWWKNQEYKEELWLQMQYLFASFPDLVEVDDD